MSQKLTKKAQKALKHRSRKQPEQEVPEPDLVEEVEAPKSKKRKRDEPEPQEVADNAGVTSAKKRKKKEGPRFICFVGQLSYNVTADQLTAHFEKACSERPEVRLLTKKTDEGKTVSKGAAFVEFKTSTAMQEALQLHQTKLGGRKITGGGGKGESRQAKLASAKARLSAQRAKKPASATEAVAEPAPAPDSSKAQGKNAKRKEKLASEGKAKPAKQKRPIKPQVSGANATRLG